MPFPLHEAIIKDNPAQVIQSIRKGGINFNESNDQGLSLLQLAAKFGMLELSIWLLYADVKMEVEQEFKDEDKHILQEYRKSPIYLAMENGHLLVAQVLIACGANQHAASRLAREFNNFALEKSLQELKLSSSVIEALYYWSTVNYNDEYNTKLIERLIPDFTASSDVIIYVDANLEHKSTVIGNYVSKKCF